MEGRWEGCHIEDENSNSDSETETENPYIIVICSGGEDTGYLIQQEIFSEDRKEEAMAYYINQDSIGAEPEIKIFYKYDENGENPYFKYYEDADLVK